MAYFIPGIGIVVFPGTVIPEPGWVRVGHPMIFKGVMGYVSTPARQSTPAPVEPARAATEPEIGDKRPAPAATEPAKRPVVATPIVEAAVPVVATPVVPAPVTAIVPVTPAPLATPLPRQPTERLTAAEVVDALKIQFSSKTQRVAIAAIVQWIGNARASATSTSTLYRRIPKIEVPDHIYNTLYMLMHKGNARGRAVKWINTFPDAVEFRTYLYTYRKEIADAFPVDATA